MNSGSMGLEPKGRRKNRAELKNTKIVLSRRNFKIEKIPTISKNTVLGLIPWDVCRLGKAGEMGIKTSHRSLNTLKYRLSEHCLKNVQGIKLRKWTRTSATVFWKLKLLSNYMF